ncbi:protein BONZAI 3-like [Arachis stenosperma]|uniref:protein BONZAI 3-like n=1 Tax=Arachis stenosperma TaxID=217475 RepID=UPI0025AD43A1|nr:protein BONZAI 3-like [Arachis stenosperma]
MHAVIDEDVWYFRKNFSIRQFRCPAEETVASKIAIEMILRCSHLDNKDIFSKSDPFLRISRVVESEGSVPICKTEVINNNLNPKWKPVTLSSRQFGSKENPLLIECFDFNSSGDHVLIGKLRSSIADLERLNKERTGTNLFIPSTHHRKEEKMLKGQLFVDQYCEREQFSFIDYVSSGFELNFMAIMEVGEVIQFYDSDRKFPAWGFGGSTAGAVSHCFNLNGSPRDSEVVGVEGIMEAYATALHNVTLSGPTLFGPVINTAAEMAAQDNNED